MLKQKFQEELKQAMLARDELRKSVLRMLLSAINYYEIQKAVPAGRQGGAGYEATDEDVMSVIQKESKQRKDSIEQFKAGQRQDLADKETKELEILQTYLPKQMTEEEIREIVKETIREIGVTTVADMGKVMAAVMPKLKGRADGSLVNQIVRTELSST